MSTQKKKFTLIEMLVVIAIIGILASMLMPTLQNSLETARGISCTNNLKNYGVNIAIYSSQNNQLPPAYFRLGTAQDTLGEILHRDIFPEEFVKIGDHSYDGRGNVQAGVDAGMSFFRCPSNEEHTFGAYGMGATSCSYAANAGGLGEILVNSNTDRKTVMRESMVKKPSILVTLAERDFYYTEAWKAYDYTTNAIDYRHNESVNLLHFDGHAATYPYELTNRGTNVPGAGKYDNGNNKMSNDGMWAYYGEYTVY